MGAAELVKMLLRRILPRPVRRALRSMVSGAPNGTGASTGFEEIAAADVARIGAELNGAWRDPGIPKAQLALAEAQLEALATGAPVPPFDVFVDILGRIPDVAAKSLLEVGCSSGYYAEVLRLRRFTTRYTGCDYSEALIELGRARFPGTALEVEDATRLNYPDAAFDIVVSGCCILHITDYPAAIREAGRVAREYVLFHRTPVLHTSPTTYYRKLAYGVPCVEIHFNETELLGHFRAANLRVVDAQAIELGSQAPPGDVQVLKSYLCQKI